MRPLLPLALAAALSACASADVALLPAEAGSPVGAVVVFDPKTGVERGVVDVANTQSRLGSGKVRVRPVASDRYVALTAAMPPPAARFTVYFQEGSTDLQPGSEPELKRAFEEIGRRTGGEIQLTGHTDTLGSDADNDLLSLQRAQEILAALVARGDLNAGVARAAGRGEREPLVSTGDGVAEPLNRRVEITVR